MCDCNCVRVRFIVPWNSDSVIGKYKNPYLFVFRPRAIYYANVNLRREVTERDRDKFRVFLFFFSFFFFFFFFSFLFSFFPRARGISNCVPATTKRQQRV